MFSVCTLAGRPSQARRAAGGRDEEVVVLEERDRAEIRAQAQDQPAAPRSRIFRPRQHHADEVIERARPHEQEEEFPVPGGVKNVAADKQPDLARPVFAQRPVDAEDSEEEPKETKLNEKHARSGSADGTDKF